MPAIFSLRGGLQLFYTVPDNKSAATMSTTKYGHLSMINSSFAILKRRDWEEVQYIIVTFYEGIPGRAVAPARAP
jgi:hypothetical protein